MGTLNYTENARVLIKETLVEGYVSEFEFKNGVQYVAVWEGPDSRGLEVFLGWCRSSEVELCN